MSITPRDRDHARPSDTAVSSTPGQNRTTRNTRWYPGGPQCPSIAEPDRPTVSPNTIDQYSPNPTCRATPITQGATSAATIPSPTIGRVRAKPSATAWS
jgi:hypothetical protein